MSRTRVQVETLALRGVADAHAMVRGLRASLADRLAPEAPTAAALTSKPLRIGAISLSLPPGANGVDIGESVARAITEAVNRGSRLR